MLFTGNQSVQAYPIPDDAKVVSVEIRTTKEHFPCEAQPQENVVSLDNVINDPNVQVTDNNDSSNSNQKTCEKIVANEQTKSAIKKTAWPEDLRHWFVRVIVVGKKYGESKEFTINIELQGSKKVMAVGELDRWSHELPSKLEPLQFVKWSEVVSAYQDFKIAENCQDWSLSVFDSIVKIDQANQKLDSKVKDILMQGTRVLAIGMIAFFISAFVLTLMLEIFDKERSDNIWPYFGLFITLNSTILIPFYIEHYNLLTTTKQSYL